MWNLLAAARPALSVRTRKVRAPPANTPPGPLSGSMKRTVAPTAGRRFSSSPWTMDSRAVRRRMLLMALSPSMITMLSFAGTGEACWATERELGGKPSRNVRTSGMVPSARAPACRAWSDSFTVPPANGATSTHLTFFSTLGLVHQPLKFAGVGAFLGPVPHVKDSNSTSRWRFVVNREVDLAHALAASVQEKTHFPPELLGFVGDRASARHVLE